MLLYKKKKSRSSPEVSLDPAGFIKIKGRSILENCAGFYDPIVEWLNRYVEEPAELTCVDIDLEYFNSATAKYIITILQRLSTVAFKDKKIRVNWYYEDGDEDILERGEYISSVLELEFNYIMVTD